MGVTRTYEIYCDDCGDGLDPTDTYLTALRALARDRGWMSTTMTDVCPKCLLKIARWSEHD